MNTVSCARVSQRFWIAMRLLGQELYQLFPRLPLSLSHRCDYCARSCARSCANCVHVCLCLLCEPPRAMASLLGKVDDVDIDSGTFKYILIKVHHSPPEGTETSKFITRGYRSASFHSDVYDQVVPGIEKLGLDCECVGGGRIQHNPDTKTIEVYGYSQGYGKADHSITVGLLKAKYPDYNKITFSNDGY
ncbi:14 kDa phosphohistidine phosphatase isoform X4 [Cherax quadricarinatus]|uniref:14 kDa phosphohistidine phosphatase isoform X4 n=1 Tax=Cherax quadricarinatus TaxID=27406 RepID=UPI002378B050|nr:14 kDa phosphohistidine phosphatase-like isoform X4 [Cherax quadricarinatus]